jgi:branched-subunit amino acid aminotransferase/4-amino-4-deoxychorismate lyase
MPVLRWSEASRSWAPVEDGAPDGLGGAQVGIYETLPASASAYALGLHADRIARSWQRLTDRTFGTEPLPTLEDARAEVLRRGWPGLRFEVRRFADGSVVAQLRRREKLSLPSPVRLLPVERGPSDAAYPHKSVEREHLTRALALAVAGGADDALIVVAGEVRETAQAFVGLVTGEGLQLPPLHQDVLPSTTRTAVADWCRERGRRVTEQAISIGDLGRGGLIYGSALVGLLPAVLVGRPATPLPSWFDGAAIERRLSE